MVEESVILEELPCGIVVIDHEEKIHYVNDWVVEASGFLREELLKSPLSKILQESVGDLIGADTRSSIPVSLLTKKNAAASVHMSIRTVPSAAMVYTYCCIMPPPDSGVITRLYPPVPEERDHFFGLFGKALQMQEVYGFIEMAAETDVNVVIQGESGTGKELVASAIHFASNRKEKPFIKVNCAALTETLLESELFGHAKGAFTGAYRDHEGKFESADKGTIFLDELGEISPAMQVKLLRVLQDRIVVRVGDNREIPVDVRVVVATNKNLRTLVTKGKFREDLFYRLNVFPIHMPALRERGTDIPLLISHFIQKFRSKTDKQIESCSADTMRILMAYCWPGNVRELENTIEHAFVLSRTQEIQAVDLPHELRVAAVREGICAEKITGIEQVFHATPVRLYKESNRLSITRESLEEELARQKGNKTATARALGISKVGLWKKMKKLGM